MMSYVDAASALVAYGKEMGLVKLRVTFPPSFYNESHIAKLYNSFFVAGFRVVQCDLNYQYDLGRFDENYEAGLDRKAGQKLRASLRNGLVFERTGYVETAYNIVRANREARNYPLRMTYDDVVQTVKIIKADFFLVRNSQSQPIASAIVFEVASGILQVIHWGNLPGSDELKPMNFLAYHIFNYYSAAHKSFIDIGPSTENSIPNLGLCNFKQSIGCDASPKLTLELDL
jgi:hypothetical protein